METSIKWAKWSSIRQQMPLPPAPAPHLDISKSLGLPPTVINTWGSSGHYFTIVPAGASPASSTLFFFFFLEDWWGHCTGRRGKAVSKQPVIHIQHPLCDMWPN